MPFFGALWIWDPFISLDELWQNCVRPATFADVHRSRIHNRALGFQCGESLPLFVFSPHCVCCWLLLLPHCSPMTVLLSVKASTSFIMDLYIPPRSSWVLVPHLDVLFALNFLYAVFGLSLASSGWPHLNPNDPEPFAVEANHNPDHDGHHFT